MYKHLSSEVSKKTYENIKKLFDKYNYKYDFNRENVAELFNVRKSRASEIINLLLTVDLIEHSEPTKYKFKK